MNCTPHVTSTLTRDLAETALTALRTQFASYIAAVDPDGPTLHPPGHDGDRWVITWDGPDEWATRAFIGGRDDDLYHEARHDMSPEAAHALATDPGTPCPPGVHAEPITAYSLALYPC